MATRTVTSVILRPNGSPWRGGVVRFRLLDDTFTITPDETIPTDTIDAVADNLGNMTVELVSGLDSAYRVIQPDGQTFDIVVPDGSSVTLESLRAAYSGSPIPATIIVGPTGPTGPASTVTGPTGPSGGPTGPTGPAGSGPTGPTGAAGSSIGVIVILASDSEATMQTKMTSAATRKLVFEPSTYTLTNSLEVPSNITIDLAGATLKHANNTSGLGLLDVFAVTNVEIFGGILDGNVANQSVWNEQRHAIRVYDSSHVAIHHNQLVNLIGDGVYVNHDLAASPPYTGCTNVDIHDNDFIGTGVNRNGVSVICARQVRIHDNYFYRMAGPPGMPGAIDLEPNNDDEFIHDVVIHGNTIDGGTTTLSIHAIAIGNAMGGDIANILIESNTISGAVRRGVQLTGSGSFTERNIVVRGNVMRDIIQSTTNVGIRADNMRALIEGNSIDTVTEDGYGVFSNGSDLEILGNTIARCQVFGIWQHTTAERGRYKDNRIIDCGDDATLARGGILILGTDCEILDNSIESSSSTITQVGIRLPSTAGKKNVIAGNHIFGAIGQQAFNITSAPQIIGPGNVLGPTNPGTVTGTYPPASETWAAGTIIYRFQPAAGGFVGWICTTGGTPGTWKTFGAITA